MGSKLDEVASSQLCSTRTYCPSLSQTPQILRRVHPLCVNLTTSMSNRRGAGAFGPLSTQGFCFTGFPNFSDLFSTSLPSSKPTFEQYHSAFTRCGWGRMTGHAVSRWWFSRFGKLASSPTAARTSSTKAPSSCTRHRPMMRAVSAPSVAGSGFRATLSLTSSLRRFRYLFRASVPATPLFREA